ERGRKLIHRGLAARQAGENGAARWIGQRRERCGKGGASRNHWLTTTLINTTVKYKYSKPTSNSPCEGHPASYAPDLPGTAAIANVLYQDRMGKNSNGERLVPCARRLLSCLPRIGVATVRGSALGWGLRKLSCK